MLSQLITKLLAIDSESYDALVNKGAALHQLGQYEAAIAAYDRVLETLPYFAEALVNKGATLDQLGRYEDAIAAYDRVLTIKPNCLEAVYNKEILLNNTPDSF